MNNKIKHLKNIKILEKWDKNGQTYYLIFNNENYGTTEAYFCWEKAIKHGWTDLKNNWTKINQIELEFEETEKGNKVIRILASDQSDNIFI